MRVSIKRMAAIARGSRVSRQWRMSEASQGLRFLSDRTRRAMVVLDFRFMAPPFGLQDIYF